MWFLLQLRAEKWKDRLKDALALQAEPYLFVDELVRELRTQTPLAKRISLKMPHALLLSGEYFTVRNFIHNNQAIVKGSTAVQGATRNLICYTDAEVQQFLLILQTPQDYPITFMEEVPAHETVKPFVLPVGPLAGLEGLLRMGPSSYGRPFYVQLLARMGICIRVPAQCVALPKTRVDTEVVEEDDLQRWYVLSARRLPAFLRKLESQGLHGDTFVPSYNVKRYGGQLEKVNVLPGYVFYRSTRQEIERMKRDFVEFFFYAVRDRHQAPLVVLDYQVEAFRRLIADLAESPEMKIGDCKVGSRLRLSVQDATDECVEGPVLLCGIGFTIRLLAEGYRMEASSVTGVCTP